MIPLRLSLSGFLSYRDRVTLDFSAFDVACIVGPNGAGKSSLLDAITWALFGRARHQDEALIHLTSQAAEVEFIFEYEGLRYRVQRIKHRNRPMQLDFMVWDDRTQHWRTLNENRLRDTQARLEQLLHIDYTTFVHASFFLQGQADRFAQESPARRKEVLSRILGLEIWKAYRQRTRERLRAVQERLEYLTLQRENLLRELEEWPHWQARLREVVQNLEATQQRLEEAEALLQEWQAWKKEVESQQAMVQHLQQAWEEARHQVRNLEARLQATRRDIQALRQQLAQGQALQQERERLEGLRQQLAHWEALAEQARQLEGEKQRLLAELQAREAQLKAEWKHLERAAQEAQQYRQALERLREKHREMKAREARLQAQVAQIPALEKQLQEVEARLHAIREETAQLRARQRTLRQWKTSLEAHAEEVCPLCGQALPSAHRDALLAHWQQETRHIQTRLQALQQESASLTRERARCETRLRELRRAQADLAGTQAGLQALEERMREVETRLRAWEEEGAQRYRALQHALASRDYARDLLARLQELEHQLNTLGYDPKAHQAAREAEARLRTVEARLHQLAEARGRLASLEQEEARLQQELAQWREREQERLRAYTAAREALQRRLSGLPRGERLEEEVLRLRERRNALQTQKGALEQQLLLLDRKQAELARLEDALKDTQALLVRLEELERAFGPNGVPALLIEQALPQIQEEANRWLERLTDGEMRVYLRTQRPYKRPRKDGAARETLDIIVSDRYGERAYETFSGGEAFRINFALRLALSRFLARRAGAHLRFLVIDEGFGSQDDEGRRRLIEAIQAVREDFAKILVITHLEDLKTLFPVRIEVRKTPTGSQVTVIGV